MRMLAYDRATRLKAVTRTTIKSAWRGVGILSRDRQQALDSRSVILEREGVTKTL